MFNTTFWRGVVLALWLVAAPTPVASADPVLTPPTLLDLEPPAPPEGVEITRDTEITVELTVAEDGAIHDVVLVAGSGSDALDAHAVAAVSTLQFAPARRDDVPIAARIPFTLRFTAPVEVPPPAPAPPAAPPAAAAEPTPIVLDVRGERAPREATAHVIRAEEARTMPGTNGDPLRAVESMPGVGRPSGLNGDLIVRGSAPQDSLIMIDGVAIPYAYHFGGLSAVVPTDALDRIDFRPGNFGPEYGRAMGGVVMLGMKAPRSDRYAGLLQVDAIDGRFLLQGPIGKRARFMIAGRRSWLDAWLPKVANGNDVSFKAAPVYWDGQLVLDYRLTRRSEARLFAFGSDDRMQLLFKATEGDPANTGTLRTNSGYLRAGLRFDTRFNDKLSMSHTLSFGPDKANLTFGLERFNFTVQQFALRSELRYRVHERAALTLGFDGQASRYDLHFYVRPYPGTDEAESPYFARPPRLFDETVWMVRPALYALAELTPWRGLRIVPSVRSDYTHDTGRFTVDPRLAVRAAVHEGAYATTLKAAAGIYHQPPQPQESVKPFGTTGVRSNRALHGSAGVEQTLFRDVMVSAELFYKYFDDLIVSVPDEQGSLIGARFENIGSGHAYGSELLVRYQGSGRVRAQLAYTLSRSVRRNADGEPLRVFAYDQTHILAALASVDLGAGFSTGFRFRFVTGVPYTPYVGGIVDLDAGAYAAVPGSPYSARLPAFQQLDLRVDKAFKLGRGTLTAYLELRNAYNYRNAESISYRYDYAEAKRATGLPILPVIGLRGEL